MIEEVCMIATEVNHNLSVVITIDRLIPLSPRDVCSCQIASTVPANFTCIGLRTVCSTTHISLN